MSHTSRLRRMPDTFRQLTGITPEAFDQLLAELEPRYPQADTKRKTRRPRQRNWVWCARPGCAGPGTRRTWGPGCVPHDGDPRRVS